VLEETRFLNTQADLAAIAYSVLALGNQVLLSNLV
jgi:hypothetical protein